MSVSLEVLSVIFCIDADKSFLYYQNFMDMIKQRISNIALFFQASLAATIPLFFSLMLLCCLKMLFALLSLTVLLILCCLTVSSLVSFSLWKLHFRLDNNSFYLATSQETFLHLYLGISDNMRVINHSHGKCFSHSGFTMVCFLFF